MVYTSQNLITSNLNSDFKIEQHLGSLKYVVNIIIWIRDTRCYKDHLGAASSAATPPTSSSTARRGRSSTSPTSMTALSKMTTARATTSRSTASGTRRKRSSRRSCLKRVLPLVTLTSPVTPPSAQMRMRRSSASKTTSPAFVSWENLLDTSLTLTPI
jgi:hypothetical protein